MSKKTKMMLAILALILLIILCVWYHAPKFANSKIKMGDISFVINKTDKNINLAGAFESINQISNLKQVFETNSIKLNNTKVGIQKNVHNETVLPVVQKILPIFIKNYKNGEISYKNSLLSVSGTTQNLNANKNINNVLNSVNSFKTINKTKIFVAPKIPTGVLIKKLDNNITLNGEFANQKDINTVLDNLRGFNIQNNATIKKNYKQLDNNSIFTIINGFANKFETGTLKYQNQRLSIEGNVSSQENKDLFLDLINIDIPTSTNINIIQIIEPIIENNISATPTKMSLSTELYSPTIEQNLSVKNQKIQKELIDILKLQNIQFKKNKATILQTSKTTIIKVADILKQYPELKIQIAGHTDSDGDAKYNQWLSQLRVNNVKQELDNNGVDISGINAVGYGESKPLVPNTNTTNKQINRRVEFIIIGE